MQHVQHFEIHQSRESVFGDVRQAVSCQPAAGGEGKQNFNKRSKGTNTDLDPRVSGFCVFGAN